MSQFNEDTLSEKPAIEQLKRMGYLFIPGEQFDPQESEDSERSSRRDVVLVSRLRTKLIELNPDASEGTIDKAIRHVTNIQGTGLLDENKIFHHELISNISIDQETGDGRRGLTVRFIDLIIRKGTNFWRSISSG
jgi:type I restriction enzyme R subunit